MIDDLLVVEVGKVSLRKDPRKRSGVKVRETAWVGRQNQTT